MSRTMSGFRRTLQGGLAMLLLAAAVPATAGGGVDVRLSEWDIALEGNGVTPGRVTFTVRNGGTTAHAFELERGGNEIVRTDPLAPGESTTVSAELAAGRYEVYCPVGGHADVGMEAEVELDAGGLRVVGGDGGESGSDGYY